MLEETMTAGQEKNKAALTSVFAAVGLTVFKIVVGLLTNSLGILAEAAHSGLDLVAALVTFFAVRISGKPADEHHPYGHGKVENLSALFETLLLLATSAWIIYEALNRLLAKTEVPVDASIWAFIVMGFSIFIDYNRSRMLYKAARKHNSQALEADALHFSTDIWSSSVVLVGLLAVKISGWVPNLSWLGKADSVAALAVAGIVVFVSIEMGIRTVRALLDSDPRDGKREKVIESIQSVEGVKNVHHVRMHFSGPILMVDVHILVSNRMSIEKVHALTQKVEAAVRTIAPGANVMVHPEPLSSGVED